MTVSKSNPRIVAASRELLGYAMGYAVAIASLLGYCLASGVDMAVRRALVTELIVSVTYAGLSWLALSVARKANSLRLARTVAAGALLIDAGSLLLFAISERRMVWLTDVFSMAFVVLLGVWWLRWWRQPDGFASSDVVSERPGEEASTPDSGGVDLGRPAWRDVSLRGKGVILALQMISLGVVVGLGSLLMRTAFLDRIPGGDRLYVQGLAVGLVGVAYLAVQVGLSSVSHHIGILSTRERKWLPLSGSGK